MAGEVSIPTSLDSPKQLFLDSLTRCSKEPGFLSAFYDRFMATSSEIRIRFVGTNFETQNRMLLRSLQLAAAATEGDADGLRELRKRAETHDRNHLNIRPPLYELWRSSLIETASEFDSEWTAEIEAAWNRILGHVIQHMTRFY